jgi:hypothetical protein
MQDQAHIPHLQYWRLLLDMQQLGTTPGADTRFSARLVNLKLLYGLFRSIVFREAIPSLSVRYKSLSHEAYHMSPSSSCHSSPSCLVAVHNAVPLVYVAAVRRVLTCFDVPCLAGVDVASSHPGTRSGPEQPLTEDAILTLLP